MTLFESSLDKSRLNVYCCNVVVGEVRLMDLDWITPKQAAEKWGMAVRQVQVHCANGKIAGAVKLGRVWLIPKSASMPIDGRTKAAKQDKSWEDTGNA
jgi:hypothetical protein